MQLKYRLLNNMISKGFYIFSATGQFSFIINGVTFNTLIEPFPFCPSASLAFFSTCIELHKEQPNIFKNYIWQKLKCNFNNISKC